ncbi:branched-chain amino acid ABC transporter permease [Variovorax sp. OV700]|jgi:branched-chain amino acid transport system permease protein|uniref:branched-chain amino acid ABC transporter permease n=1 Tax=Variovorax sp. OV700 TaxID=1882826 RepID=UPI0008862E68|nr:branched-chain amino acid ABC transporter permease [Variovorax sp. OV700]SDH78559.1 branched-chain amino acid transport system permease protein [Variovorax sp. OV700]
MGAYETSLLTLVAIHVILALSLNLITGLCGQVSLGHAAFFGVGAYATALLAKAGFGMAVTVSAALLLAGIVGLVVGFCSLRVRDDFLAIATMAAGFLFVGAVRTTDALGGELGISQIPATGLGSAYPLLVVACAASTGLVCWVVKRSWLGYVFEAVSADEPAARSLGIDTPLYKLAAFTIGTALAGLAGCLYAYHLGNVGTEAFGFPVSVMILAMVVIGGMGSLWGSVLAAALLTLAPEWFRFVNDYKLLVFGLLLFAIMRIAPQGLFPWLVQQLRLLRAKEIA